MLRPFFIIFIFETHEFNYNAQYKAVRKLLYGIMATGMVPIFSMTEYFGGDVSCLSNKGIKVQIEKLKMNIVMTCIFILNMKL